MAGNAGFSVTITAVDAATKQIEAVNRKLKELAAPVDRTRKAFGQLAETTGLRTVDRTTKSLADNMGQLFVNASRAVPVVASLTGALSAAGMAEAIKKAAAYGNQLAYMATQAGVAIPELQKIGDAASAAGGDAQGAIQGVGDLAKNIALLMHTGKGSPEFMAGLAILGVSLKDTNGKARTTGDVLNDILHKLAAIQDPQQRAAEGAMVLGDHYRDFAFELQNGVKGLDAYQAIAARSVTANGDQVQALATLQGSFNHLSDDVTGLATAIAGDLAPDVTTLINQMSAWIEKNKDWLDQDIVTSVREISTDVRVVASDINDVVQALGGWKTAAEIVGGYMVVSKLLPIIGGAAQVVMTITKITRALMLMRDAANAASIAETITEAGGLAGLGALGVVGGLAGLLYYESKTPTSPEELADSGYARQTMSPRLGGPPMVTKTAVNKSIDPVMRGLLDAIAAPESRGDYNAKNPTSSARGRYQFTDSTWAEEVNRLGLKDDSPANQDLAAADLAQREYATKTGGRNLLADLKVGGYEGIIAATLGGRWPSLPGGSQALESLGTFTTLVSRGTYRELQEAKAARLPIPPIPPAAPPAPYVTTGAGAPGQQNVNVTGGANLTVKLAGAPPGTQVSSTTSGNVFSGAPRIETSMPDSAMHP